MKNDLRDAIQDLLNTCTEVKNAHQRLSIDDARLRRSVQHQQLAARAIEEMLNRDDSASAPPE